MKTPATYLRILTFLSFALSPAWLSAADDRPPAELEAELAAREKVAQGGDFEPDPRTPVVVAVGKGGRIITSSDDGASWEQVFFGAPTVSHGHWVTRSLAYTEGMFATSVGWGQPPMTLASDDGVNWRHLAPPPEQQEGEMKVDPMEMPGAWTMAGGAGTFIYGNHRLTTTPDFGKTWYETHVGREFREDARKLSTHHLKPYYLGTPGHFIVLGQDRNKEGTSEGNLFLTKDNGKTWQWLETSGLENGDGMPEHFVSMGEFWLLCTREGNVYRSTDEGLTWERTFEFEGHWPYMTLVNGEVWLVGKSSFSSKDGIEWTALPESIPDGKLLETSQGTLLSIDGRRDGILRSTDGGETWEEVYTFEGVEGANGLADIQEGKVKAGAGSPVASADATALRTWTSTAGSQIEARFVSGVGENVTLETKDGRKLNVELSELSPEDREIIENPR